MVWARYSVLRDLDPLDLNRARMSGAVAIPVHYHSEAWRASYHPSSCSFEHMRRLPQ